MSAQKVRRFLVVANETLGGRELLLKLEELDTPRGSARFHVVVPATRVNVKGRKLHTDRDGRPIVDHHANDLARHRLKAALALLADRGSVATGEIGSPDPFSAVATVLDRPIIFDEIIVSTLPVGISRWLKMDLPHRLNRKFVMAVTHVESLAAEDIAEVVVEPLAAENHDLSPATDRVHGPVRVLLVEDSSTDAQLTHLALERSELDVELEVCTNGRDALAGLTTADPHPPTDLVLLDLRLPEMDGFELLEQLGRSRELRELPVVILTTSDLDEDRDRAHELGALAYVVKDPDFVRFQEVLESIVVEQASATASV